MTSSSPERSSRSGTRCATRTASTSTAREKDGETYTHGTGAIVRGLERALDGKRPGDKLDVTIRPDEAYGHKKRGPGPQPIPRGTFPPEAELRIGMKFQAESPDGRPLDLYIARVEQREVFVDTNHPFAGMTLRYEVEVLSVKNKE
jgi:FKBP-type peptidyl-prolyl cis-trans isomerase SlyD